MREIRQLQKKPGIALVLSGGATKAFYFHLGVLKALHPEPISAIVGTSAGSVIGAFIASGISVETLLTTLYQKQVYLPKFDTWIKTLTSTMLFKPKYMGVLGQSVQTGLAGLRFLASLPGLINKDILAEAIDQVLQSQSHTAAFFDSVALEDLFHSVLPSMDFSETDIDLYVTATALDRHKRAVFNGVYDFEDGDNLFLRDVPMNKAVRASSAIPGMFDPVKIKGNYYVDGEIRQTLSADIGISLSDRVIVSHTYQPLQLPQGQSVAEMGWLNILKQSLSTVFYERIAIWRKIYEQENPDKAIIWIHPDPEDVDFFLAPEFSFRPEIQAKMIECGERAALRAFEAAGKKVP